jgi:hypothetical protein
MGSEVATGTQTSPERVQAVVDIIDSLIAAEEEARQTDYVVY